MCRAVRVEAESRGEQQREREKRVRIEHASDEHDRHRHRGYFYLLRIGTLLIGMQLVHNDNAIYLLILTAHRRMRMATGGGG